MRRPLLERSLPLLLPLAVLAAYWPSLAGGFVWDDDAHVTRPDLRGFQGLWRIWTEPGATQQYYPVLHSAFWVEHRLWGDAALGYHLLNALLHAGVALLLYRLLSRLRAPGALLAAAAFALHPVCVESVAWVSEQKNTLSGVLCLLSALAYLGFDEDRRRRSYLAATALFALALLAKSVTATLPGALLVLLWWRRGRLSARRDVAPLVPWLAMSAAAGFMTAWMERTYIGARGSAFDLGILDRFLLAGRAAWFYAAKDAWPAGLLFVYPRWVVDSHAAWQYLFPLAVAVLVVFLFLLRGRSRGPLAATLLFLGTLFPALGFINVYPFVFSFVADHFQYLSCAGLLAFAAGGLASASESLGGRLGPAVRAASAAWVAVLGFLTWRQCHDYADVRTLYESVLRENPDCWLMHDNLGVVLVRDGKPGPAAEHFRQAMRLNPSYPEAFNNYGNLLARAGRLAEAEAAYAGALSARPGFAAAEYDWGFALSQSGRIEEAIPHFRNAIRMDAGYAEPHYELANALANLGRVDAAVTEYQAALRILPEFPEASANLGLAYASRGDWTRALPPLDTAVRLSPSYPQAHAFRGFALAGLGRYGEALDEYATAVKLGADTADVHVQMAAALDKLGRSTESRSELARARQIEASERDHGR